MIGLWYSLWYESLCQSGIERRQSLMALSSFHLLVLRRSGLNVSLIMARVIPNDRTANIRLSDGRRRLWSTHMGCTTRADPIILQGKTKPSQRSSTIANDTSSPKDVIAYSALFAVTVSILRASILMLYTRLFPVSGSFTAQVWILHILNISYAIVAVICFPLQCIPLAKVWTPTLPGRCMDVTRLLLSTVITTIVLDLAVFLLPIPILLRLQMSVTRKLALCGVFLMGTG